MDTIDSRYLISSCWRVPISEQFIHIIIIDCERPQMMVIYWSYLWGGDRVAGALACALERNFVFILSIRARGVINFNNTTLRQVIAKDEKKRFFFKLFIAIVCRRQLNQRQFEENVTVRRICCKIFKFKWYTDVIYKKLT